MCNTKHNQSNNNDAIRQCVYEGSVHTHTDTHIVQTKRGTKR